MALAGTDVIRASWNPLQRSCTPRCRLYMSMQSTQTDAREPVCTSARFTRNPDVLIWLTYSLCCSRLQQTTTQITGSAEEWRYSVTPNNQMFLSGWTWSASENSDCLGVAYIFTSCSLSTCWNVYSEFFVIIWSDFLVIISETYWNLLQFECISRFCNKCLEWLLAIVRDR